MARPFFRSFASPITPPPLRVVGSTGDSEPGPPGPPPPQGGLCPSHGHSSSSASPWLPFSVGLAVCRGDCDVKTSSFRCATASRELRTLPTALSAPLVTTAPATTTTTPSTAEGSCRGARHPALFSQPGDVSRLVRVVRARRRLQRLAQ